MPDTSVYDLLDRPIADLPEPDSMLLAAMRGWVHALTLHGDPAAAAGRVLADPDAATAFDRAMRTLDRGSADQLVFQRPCHSHVGDAEAVMLAIWRQLDHGEHAVACATLRLLIDAQAAGVAAAAMAQATALIAHRPVVRG